MSPAPRFLNLLRVLAGLICGAVSASAAESSATFHQKIIETYSFAPHELSSAQQTEKSKTLDAIWETVKSQQAALLPLLRAELACADQPKFFYYDGASLLLSLSKSPDDRQLAARAIARSDIRDVQRNEYFYTVRSLIKDGTEATDAALNILHDPKFLVIVPAHALTLGADYALIYLFNYADPAIYVPKLIAAYESNPGEEARFALVTALWYSLDPRALDYVAAIHPTDQLPAKLKERVVDLQKRTRGYRGKDGADSGEEAKLREKRKDSLRRVSDEALYEYENLTREILKKTK